MKPLSRALLFLARHLPRGYWRVVRFAAKRDAALWDLPLPLRFLPDTCIRADLREPVFTQFLRCGCFPHQAGEDIICMSLLRPGDLVFDVGANIGYPTILFSQAVEASGKVVALEPSPRAFRLLQRTLGSELNVQCLNLAASDHEGEAHFYETESLATSSLQPVSNVKSYTVTTTTLDNLVSSFGAPAFVKIDVEGHEPSVIRGMKHLLQRDVPPIVLFEALSGSALQDILAEFGRLAKNRYTVFRAKLDGTLTSLNDPDGTDNYLALPAWGMTRIDNLQLKGPGSISWIIDHVLIGDKEQKDRAAVQAVNASAFETPAEADLVDALREQAHPVISLVAEEIERIVGHIMFPPVSLSGHRGLKIMGLAPMN